MSADPGFGLWLAALWGIGMALVAWRTRGSTELTAYDATVPADAPKVTMVVPARDEAGHIADCVRSILMTTWTPFELIVVDDHSTDGTGELARAAAQGDPRAAVIVPPPLPEDWFGKQWACHHAVRRATGEILIFTDADTRHSPELVARAVSAMRARGADILSVAGTQEMVSFWEKLVQPFVFVVLFLRYGGTDRMSRAKSPRDKIANGQFFMVTRAAYDRVGGHEAVKGNVAEDLRLAQLFTEAGMSTQMVLATDFLSTRMYDSLAAIRRGWGKNMYASGRYTVPQDPISQFLFRMTLPFPAIAAVAPPVLALLGLYGFLGDWALWFGAVAFVMDVGLFASVHIEQRTNPFDSLLHPLAAAIFAWIAVEAVMRGDRVSWKGRTYISR